MTTTIKAETSTQRAKRYRKQHRRFDYVPAPDALEIIEIYLAKYSNEPMCKVLDAIVRTAHNHIQSRKNSVSGNT